MFCFLCFFSRFYFISCLKPTLIREQKISRSLVIWMFWKAHKSFGVDLIQLRGQMKSNISFLARRLRNVTHTHGEKNSNRVQAQCCQRTRVRLYWCLSWSRTISLRIQTELFLTFLLKLEIKEIPNTIEIVCKLLKQTTTKQKNNDE